MINDKNVNDIDKDKFQIFNKKTENTSPNFQIFEKWLLDNGATFVNLEINNNERGIRSVCAKQDIMNDTVIMEIPLRFLITVEMGKNTIFGRRFVQSEIPILNTNNIFLTMFLLLDQCNKHSFFRPYYNILPTQFSNMPVLWKHEELKWLKGSFMATEIKERRSMLFCEYSEICSLCPDFKNYFPLEIFIWARICVCSRNFGIIINGVRTAALVPFADMLNHYRPRETSWGFDDTLQSFTVTSLNEIRVGAQVYDSYGSKSNHLFLLNYGFSVENNIENDGSCPNEVVLYIHISKSDPEYDRKISLCSKSFHSSNARIFVSVDYDQIMELISILRVVVGNTQDIDSISEDPTLSKNPINFQNEYAVMLLLQDITKKQLSLYPNNIRGDVASLGALPMFSNQRNAVIQVQFIYMYRIFI
jgi:histone-lysine N-methyltransferase SETD3